jgi:hypothetical protein
MSKIRARTRGWAGEQMEVGDTAHVAMATDQKLLQIDREKSRALTSPC